MFAPSAAATAGRTKLGVADRREVDEPGAVLELGRELRRELQPEPGLARPAWAGQRDQPRAVDADQLEDVDELALATEQRLELRRQVRVVHAPQRRKIAATELVETDAPNVLEPVVAEAANLGLRLDQIVRRLREHDLSAVCCAHDPGRDVHVDADVVPVRDERLAGVQADAHAYRSVRERGLRIDGCVHSVARALERDEERISLRVNLDTAVASEDVTQQTLVRGEDVGVAIAQLLEQLCRPLDVTEEKGDRARRQPTHADRIAQWSRRWNRYRVSSPSAITPTKTSPVISIAVITFCPSSAASCASAKSGRSEASVLTAPGIYPTRPA